MSRDVIVVGGGPAGASAAAILAEQGLNVLILEKKAFPRYHIGESMIPYCYFPLERLGLIPAMKASAFTRKLSVQFVSTEGKVSQPFYFHQHLRHEASTTWQVVRSDFDRLLLDNAVGKGASLEVDEACDFIMDGEIVAGVETLSGRRLEARAVIDASGRDGLSLRKFGWRERDRNLERISIWNYFKGALRDPGDDAGATTVAYLPDKGWFWYIPLPGDVVSVGIVAHADYLYREGRDLAAIFERERRANPWIDEHLAGSSVVENYRITGEYSYRSRHCAREGLLLCGDAFAFLDPVFSSGLYLALQSGVMAGEACAQGLRSGGNTGAIFADYGRKLCASIEAMRKLVYAFYDPNFSFRDLVMAHPELKGDVTDLLIGHLDRDYTELFAALGNFAKLPADLGHGGILK